MNESFKTTIENYRLTKNIGNVVINLVYIKHIVTVVEALWENVLCMVSSSSDKISKSEERNWR